MFNSVVQVERLVVTTEDGLATYDWQPVPGLVLPCRLDLQFMRRGKDAPPPTEAGVAPSRFGLAFCEPEWDLRASDRLRTQPDELGEEPVKGVFEIRDVPDVVNGMAYTHHYEIPVVEVSQAISFQPSGSSQGTPWPAPTGVVNPE
jgi:hypothetical protein